jgi:hypothetical protein
MRESMSHIFISYSHKDTDYAHKLADKLQSDGFEVWIDARLDYGSQWPLELQRQLDSCGAFILIMSSHSFASEWVQNELSRAKRKFKPIFPMLLEGDEPWLSVEATQYFDVRNGNLPDKKFYDTLGQVISLGAQAGPSFSSDSKKSRAAKSASIPKFWVGIIAAAIICVVAALSVIVISTMLSNPPEVPTLVPAQRPTNTPQPPTQPATATDSSDVVQIVPTFTPSNVPRIYDFQTCPAACNGHNSTNNFAAGITKIYAQFNYENFKSGIPYTRTWSMNGREWIRYTCAWDGPESGAEILKFTEPKGLASGTWDIRITVDNEVIFEEQIVIVGNGKYWDPAGTINACHGTN